MVPKNFVENWPSLSQFSGEPAGFELKVHSCHFQKTNTEMYIFSEEKKDHALLIMGSKYHTFIRNN